MVRVYNHLYTFEFYVIEIQVVGGRLHLVVHDKRTETHQMEFQRICTLIRDQVYNTIEDLQSHVTHLR